MLNSSSGNESVVGSLGDRSCIRLRGVRGEREEQAGVIELESVPRLGLEVSLASDAIQLI